jgi:hypothetical protein
MMHHASERDERNHHPHEGQVAVAQSMSEPIQHNQGIGSPMRQRRFIQCDVFTSVPTRGNGLAVVVDGEGLSDHEMQALAAWTNLAETTFLMSPTTKEADYRVRIFSPSREVPFAGHPTLGSCASWICAGGKSRTEGIVKQECGVGIVDIDVSGAFPAFAAPKTTIAPVPPEKLEAIISALGLTAIASCVPLSLPMARSFRCWSWRVPPMSWQSTLAKSAIRSLSASA